MTEVRSFAWPSNEPFVLNNSRDWQVVNGRIVDVWAITGAVHPFLIDITWSEHMVFARIEIDWQANDEDVPKGVRDGVALLAGALVKRGKVEARNIMSETIGDYSYTLNVRGTEVHLSALSPMGWSLIRPFIRRSVRVT